MRTVVRRTLILTGLFFIYSVCVYGQKVSGASEFRFSSRNTSFPDSIRSKGYSYDSVFYSADDHYRDSSVLVIVPKNLERRSKVDLVFWFHGWRNNIDTANRFYEIEKQFLASHKNAVLVLAETAKNAPDSYGGKLEQKGRFNALVNDVLDQLKAKRRISKRAVAGQITLAGHSGAYRVIASILAVGESPVSRVILFDALYGQTDKFMSWVKADSTHQFVNWYTNKGGGTDDVSIQMMRQLKELGLPFQLVEEANVDGNIVKANRILFVHSPREHNIIINQPDNLELVLKAGK